MLKIHRAITDSLEQANFGLEVSWPNKGYLPHEDADGESVPFLELVFGRIDINPLTLGGDEGVDRVSAFFTINVRYATNRGAVIADDMVSNILAYYSIGKEFAYGGQIVRVTGISLEPGAPDFGWYKVSVTIKYESYQGRA